VPLREFLYLDVTLVVQKDMRPLLEFAFGRPEDLVVVKDWYYDCFNSCVMRVRQTEALAQVARAFQEGKTYSFRNPGDQDFLHACTRDLGILDRVAFFEPEHVVSYRNLRNLNRTDPADAYTRIGAGTIVKFHGRPKMHQVLNPYYNLTRIRMKNLTMGRRDSRFYVKELRQNWR
jgi:hypothetical protein